MHIAVLHEETQTIDEAENGCICSSSSERLQPLATLSSLRFILSRHITLKAYTKKVNAVIGVGSTGRLSVCNLTITNKIREEHECPLREDSVLNYLYRDPFGEHKIVQSVVREI